jgi:hypothetical protein
MKTQGQTLQTRLQSGTAGLALDVSTLGNFRFIRLFSLFGFLLTIGVFSMNYRAIFDQLRKQKVSPCAAWTLAQLVVAGRAKVQDLADQGMYTRPALSVACAELQIIGLLDKDRDKYFQVARIYTEKTETSDPNNPKRLYENQNENEKTDEKDEKSEKQKPRDLSSSVVKPLKAEFEKNNSSSSNSKGTTVNPGAEKIEEEEIFLYGQNICNLDREKLREIAAFCINADHMGELLDNYRWLHVENHGTPIGNVVGWCRTTVKNGIIRQAPYPLTFACWKRDRDRIAKIAAQAPVTGGPVPRPAPITPEQLAAARKFESEMRAFNRKPFNGGKP